jgi:hypothetical protein
VKRGREYIMVRRAAPPPIVITMRRLMVPKLKEAGNGVFLRGGDIYTGFASVITSTCLIV